MAWLSFTPPGRRDSSSNISAAVKEASVRLRRIEGRSLDPLSTDGLFIDYPTEHESRSTDGFERNDQHDSRAVRRASIDGAFNSLDNQVQVIFHRHRILGHSHKTIADDMNIDVEAVELAVAEAITRMAIVADKAR